MLPFYLFSATIGAMVELRIFPGLGEEYVTINDNSR